MSGKLLFIVLFLLNFSIAKAENTDTLLFETFDSQLSWATGWKSVSSSSSSWFVKNIAANSFNTIDKSNKYSAICPWSFAKQTEALLAPGVQTYHGRSLSVTFYAGFNKKFATQSRIELYISLNSVNWTKIWSSTNDKDTYNDWAWRYQEVKIDSFAGSQIYLNWYVVGENGDLIALDNVAVIQGIEDTKTDILSFSLPDLQTKEAQIDNKNKIIIAEIPFTYDRYAILAPQFTLSTGASSTPALGQEQTFNFSDTVVYNIIANHPSFQTNWKIVVNKKDYEAEILSFNLPDLQIGATLYDRVNGKITVKVPSTSVLTKITPRIILSSGANCTPITSTIIDLTKTVTYTVTSANTKVQKVWRIVVEKVNITKNNNIIGANIVGQTLDAQIDTITSTVNFQIPYGSDLSKISPILKVTSGAIIDPPSGTLRDFSTSSLNYIVTPSDASILPKSWTVNVNWKKDAKEITVCRISNQTKTALIDSVNGIVYIEIEYDLSRTNIVLDISVSKGASMSPNNLSNFKFSYPYSVIDYTVISPDGKIKVWKIQVTMAKAFIFKENFDKQENILLWKKQSLSLSNETWKTSNINNYNFQTINASSNFSMVCNWDYKEAKSQDEWIYSPLFDLSQFRDNTLQFYVFFNPIFNHNQLIDYSYIELFISTDNVSWNKIWTSLDVVSDSAKWHKVVLNIDKYISANVSLSFHYSGKQGDVIGVDDILVTGQNISSLNTEKQELLNIYPNPTSDFIQIEHGEMGMLTIMNSSGRIIMKNYINEDNFKINISHLNNGVYFIIFNQKVAKFVKI